MLKLQKKDVYILLLMILFVAVFTANYVMTSRIGAVVLPAEALVLGLSIIFSGRIRNCFNWKSSLFLILSIYRIISSGIMSLSSDAIYIRNIIYKELGMVLAVCVCVDCIKKERFIYLFRNIGIVLSLIGCYEYAFKISVFYRYVLNDTKIYMINNFGTSNARVRTIFLHPIICGVYTTAFWIILLYYPLKNKYLDLSVKIVTVICLIGTQSRSSWVSFAVVTIVYILAEKNKDISISINGFVRYCVTAFICVLLLMFFYDKLYEIILSVWRRLADGLNSGNASNYNRVIMIQNGIREWSTWGIIDKLTGKGNGYALRYLQSHSILGWTTAVDNQYLSLLLNSGLIGVFMYIAMANGVFYEFIKNKNSLNRACNLIILSMFLSSFFYEMLSWEICMIIFCIFMAIKNVEAGSKDE